MVTSNLLFIVWLNSSSRLLTEISRGWRVGECCESFAISMTPVLSGLLEGISASAVELFTLVLSFLIPAVDADYDDGISQFFGRLMYRIPKKPRDDFRVALTCMHKHNSTPCSQQIY